VNTLDERGDLAGAAEIGRKREDFAAFVRQSFSSGAEGGGVAGTDGHARLQAHEPARNGQTDAATSAGNERGLSGERFGKRRLLRFHRAPCGATFPPPAPS